MRRKRVSRVHSVKKGVTVRSAKKPKMKMTFKEFSDPQHLHLLNQSRVIQIAHQWSLRD